MASRTDSRPPVEVVGETLEGYARRGQFRAFSRRPSRSGRAVFRLRWHGDRDYECIFDPRRKTLRFPALLPNVEPTSGLNRELRAFVASCHSEDRPEHRRIDPARASARSVCRNRAVSLSLTVVDGDYEYGTRKLVHLVHELFVAFLRDGPYTEYLVENLGLEPDSLTL